MLTKIRNRFQKRTASGPANGTVPSHSSGLNSQIQEVRVAREDPLMEYILSHAGILEIDQLDLPGSEALETLKRNGIKVSVPLVSQGELIGMLNLGPRLSEQEYSSDDRRLLNTLSVQASPALRVAQLARRRQVEARERERMENEMRVARMVQQTLLPKEVPDFPGWTIKPFWQPARAVSGDFYDFFPFPDGRIAMVIADVTDKGMPAALVMTDTRRILRSQAERLVEPGAVLKATNEVLLPDIPPRMFATCLYLLLDPSTGKFSIGNAGHNLPCLRSTDGEVRELNVRGMPLGLLPDMEYEEIEINLQPGEQLFLYSDGFTEAHNPLGEMFEFPRLLEQIKSNCSPEEIVKNLYEFTGSQWEQEDDMTILIVQRDHQVPVAETILVDFQTESAPNNERQAVQRVLEALQPLRLDEDLANRVATATSEAVMNAMEHGNGYQPDRPVRVRVSRELRQLRIRVADAGDMPPASQPPDIEAKLEGHERYRGWGRTLIDSMVDRSHHRMEDGWHVLVLEFDLDQEVNHA